GRMDVLHRRLRPGRPADRRARTRILQTRGSDRSAPAWPSSIGTRAMSGPSFFPSRTVTVYLARLFLTRTAVALLMLVLILQTLDLLSQSGHILAYPGNGEAEIWRYVSLRVPQIIAQFLPFSALLGTIIAL